MVAARPPDELQCLAMPRSVALSGLQAAFDFIDARTRKWDNEIEVLHNHGDGCMLKSSKPMEGRRIAGHYVSSRSVLR